MALRKDMGISENGDVRLNVVLELTTDHQKPQSRKILAGVNCNNLLPMLLKSTHLKNAERLMASQLKDVAIGQFQTAVVCLINDLVNEELAQDKLEPTEEMLPISESPPGD